MTRHTPRGHGRVSGPVLSTCSLVQVRIWHVSTAEVASLGRLKRRGATTTHDATSPYYKSQPKRSIHRTLTTLHTAYLSPSSGLPRIQMLTEQHATCNFYLLLHRLHVWIDLPEAGNGRDGYRAASLTGSTTVGRFVQD